MTLTELKRKLYVGARYEIIEHRFHPECVGHIRQVTRRGETIMYSVPINDPESKWATCNNGLGAKLNFDKAENWSFHDDVCEYYSTRHGGRLFVFSFRLLDN